MSDCCSNSASNTTTSCPACGSSSKSVDTHTLYHQVRSPENRTIPIDNYFFCPDKKCPIAYFSMTGNPIPKQQLTSYNDILNDKLCYCFDIDTAEYLLALDTNQAEAIKNVVIQRTKAGECACETKNPSAQCCLAQFKHLEKEHKTS
jgi:Zinc binding domain